MSSCLQKLRVPDNLLGKKVNCPSARRFSRRSSADIEKTTAAVTFSNRPVPEPKKKPVRKNSDEDDDSDEDEGDEDEERRPKKKKKRRHNAEALKKVSAPATGLQVTAALMIVYLLATIPFTFVPSLQERIFQALHQPVPPDPTLGVRIFQGIMLLVAFLVQIAIFSGASKMKQLESYRQALIISIVAFLPCTCCFLGLPIGIWSLVVIHSPEVRSYFKA